MTFTGRVEAENSLIMVSDWSRAVPFAKLNSTRGTKTCFVQHWHQRKAGRSRPTMAFLFLQDSWCLHQQNAQMPSIPRVCLSHKRITQITSPQGLFQRVYLLQPHKGTVNPQWGHTIVRFTTLTSSTKDLPEGTQHSQPQIQAVISQSEGWPTGLGAESKFTCWSRHSSH